MDIKGYLIKKSKVELVDEIIILSKKIPMVKEYYSNLLGNSEDVLNKYKKLIKQEYFPSRGDGKARAGVARKLLSEFKKISKSNTDMIDLLLYHVEQGVSYTIDYGDIDERFYSSIELSFNNAADLIITESLFQEYKKRCLKIVNDTNGMGWGFHDYLADVYYSTFNVKDI